MGREAYSARISPFEFLNKADVRVRSFLFLANHLDIQQRPDFFLILDEKKDWPEWTRVENCLFAPIRVNKEAKVHIKSTYFSCSRV